MSLEQRKSFEFPIVESKPEVTSKAEETEVLKKVAPSKEIIKLPELINMDPLDYFSRFLGIPEMILQHFNGKGLLAKSEVSPSWYNLIASSKVLMQKLKIVFDRDFYFNGCFLTRSEGFDLMKNSTRLYQNIKVRLRFDDSYEPDLSCISKVDQLTDSELDLFYSKAHEWKNVSLENLYFKLTSRLWKLLSSIESSVERIYIADRGRPFFVDHNLEIESLEALKFPKLKQLELVLYWSNSVNFGDILARFLMNSAAIEEFYFSDFSHKVHKEVITKMLESFDKLTILSLNLPIIHELFEDQSLKKFKFKLNSLAIRTHVFCDLGPNFPNFLRSQSDYLEKLEITLDDGDRATFGVIMKMPKLKSLKLRYSEPFSVNEIPTKWSTSIFELNLKGFANAFGIKFLLGSMPNVTNLKLKSMDKEIFEMLKTMNRKFDSLRVVILKGVDRKEMEEIMIKNYTSLEIDLVQSV